MNFTHLIRGIARRFRFHDAVVTDDRTESFSEFWSNIASAGQLYVEHGVGVGDRVLLILPNCHEFLHFHFGALKIGAVSVLVNHGYTWWEVRRIITNCEPRLVVSDAEWLGRNLARLELSPATQALSIESIKGRMPHGSDAVHPVRGRAIASLNYSYFGDGYPKGAMLTHANHIYAAIGYARHQGFRCDDRLLVILPMSHVYALSGCVNSGLIRGAALVPSNQHTPRGVFRAVERHRITILSSVPVMFEYLAGYGKKDRYDLSSLRLLVTGGSYMPADRQREFEAALGAQMVQGYGLTECLPVICNPPGAGNRHGTLGVPGRRDIFIRIVGEDGRTLPPGAVGEIQLHSTTTMAGYYRLPEDTRRLFDGDWLRTGDRGALDEDGYLYFHGMTKQIFNIYGNKIDPIEVRDVILEHPAVVAAEVSAGERAGHSDRLLGELRIHARVTPRWGETISQAELRAFCMERLAAYKVPHAVEVEEAIRYSPPADEQ